MKMKLCHASHQHYRDMILDTTLEISSNENWYLSLIITLQQVMDQAKVSNRDVNKSFYTYNK
jgi:hypothetical protein